MTPRYDIIPDIHAEIDRLTQTLLSLGYVADRAGWAHPEGRMRAHSARNMARNQTFLDEFTCHDDVKRSIVRPSQKGIIQQPPMGEVKNHLV